MYFGAHCSGGIRGAVATAAEMGAEAVQLFAQSPRAWRFPEHHPADLERFREARAAAGLKAALIHTLYLVNLATADETVYGKSLETVLKTMDAAAAIEADGVVMHVGSHRGTSFDEGLERAVPALQEVLARTTETTWLLLEDSAGAGDTVGRSVDELAALCDALGRHERLGICLDTCHLWVSGIDVTDPEVVDAMLEEIDERIGLDRLRALHVNDAAAPLGSNRDRHAAIGEGALANKLRVFLGHPKLQGRPAVLETPGPDGHGPNAAELKRVRAIHRRGLRSAAARR